MNCFSGERVPSVATDIFEAGFVPACDTINYEGNWKQDGTNNVRSFINTYLPHKDILVQMFYKVKVKMAVLTRLSV